MKKIIITIVLATSLGIPNALPYYKYFGINVYACALGTSKLEFPNSNKFTTTGGPGAIQAFIVDKFGQAILLWADSTCSTPVYFIG
jgi:hypothetical protein